MELNLFTTTPQSVEFNSTDFLKELKRIIHQSEAHEYQGTLIYSDNRLIDPWLVADLVVSETQHLLPMIALQPVYMHPYTVAKKISTIGYLYERPIALNLIAGGFKNDLTALDDQTEHDRRYDRLLEYTEIIQQLLQSDQPVTYEGEFYSIYNLKLSPPLPDQLMPEWYLSGSSDAAHRTAERLEAKLLEYPEPASHYLIPENMPTPPSTGVRLGILARATHEEAWREARHRFPETRQGKLTHKVANAVSDSKWHHRLSEHDGESMDDEPVYWLGPFQHYQTFCPYLVGQYEEVAQELSHYLRAGYNTYILDIPVSEAELQHTLHVFKLAQRHLNHQES
jgi:alkanesulfonate monooxygenase